MIELIDKDNVEYRKKRRFKHTNEELLEHLRQFYRENGRAPCASDFTNNKTYQDRFGSWNNAIKMAGLQNSHKSQYTDKELIEYLIKFKEETDRTPKAKEFLNNSKYPSWKTYQDRFGSWNNAIKMAGLDNNHNFQYTDDELLEFLRQFNKENGVGVAPTENDFINNSKYPNFSTYQRHFGSWSNALKLVT